jgi:hypothetical protein
MTPEDFPQFSHQLITKRDLFEFKNVLLTELKEIMNCNSQPPKWIRSADVRLMLKISPATLQTLRINGTLNYSKIGGIIYYKAAEIQKLLENS